MPWIWILSFAAFLGGVNWWLYERPVSRPPGGFVWNTSLTRDDTGDGACEIVWVETLKVR